METSSRTVETEEAEGDDMDFNYDYEAESYIPEEFTEQLENVEDEVLEELEEPQDEWVRDKDGGYNNNLFLSLKNLKASTNAPDDITINNDCLDNLSETEKNSIEFESLLTNSGASKHGKENIIKWVNSYLEEIGVGKAFTINMHYMNHLSEAITALGPLRLVSARPLERMIGNVKSSIKSRQKPSENSSNCVKNHFAAVYKAKCITTDDNLVNRYIVFGKEITKGSCRNLVERFHECTEAEEAAIETVVDIQQEAQLIESYFPIRSGKELKLTGKPSRKGTFIIYCAQSDNEGTSHRCMEGTANLKYGQLLFMYNNENVKCVLIKTIFPFRYNVEQDCHYYYKNNSLIHAFEAISISSIVSYDIEIAALNEKDIECINLVWGRF